MFCTKCGYEHSGDTDYCIQCGASVVSEAPIGEITNNAVPMTKKEYFMDKCSTSTKQKRKAVKILSAVSLAIQGVLAVLFVVGLSVLAYAIEQNPQFGGSTSGAFSLVITLALIFTAGAFVFTILGIKKNSTGFFVAATIFSFLSATFGSNNFENRFLRQLIAFGTLAIYIAIVVLNYQSNKEYKEYTSKYITTKKGYKKYISQYFTTNKEGGLKKVLVLVIGLVLLCAFTASALSSCSAKSCHNCGDSVGSDPVKAGGRTYCSYDCYMDEVLFD